MRSTWLFRLLPASAVMLAACVLAASPAPAADYFIPGQPHAAGPAPARAPRHAAPVAPVEPAPPPPPAPAPGVDIEAQTPQQQQLPPAPVLPSLPKAPTPPAAVIGVFDVPETMRDSSAAQQVEKIIGERREKLNEDVQKEQAAWRDLQQSLLNDRARLSRDQVAAREAALEQRITTSQRVFRARARVLQDASQYALSQIERTMQMVLEQVAADRGMNLVLHRQQTALNFNAFDITDLVVQQMNKVLPSVLIPPDGQEPPTVAATPSSSGVAPGTQPATPPTAAPATKGK